MSYDDDFYSEPSEFEMQIDEFKQSLLKSVKDQFIAEMDSLRTENSKLQDVKKNFDQIKREYANKEQQLENERRQIVQQVRRESLKKLLEDYQVIMWSVKTKREVGPKCERCDEHRRIHFITPTGRKTHEDCLCKEGKQVFVPKENIRVEFKKRDSDFIVWYTEYGDNEDGYKNGQVPKNIYNDSMKFEDMKDNYYLTYFREIEDCQRFCDLLNGTSEAVAV